MCGIFGIAYRDRSTIPDGDRLRASVNALKHRGPDARGYHLQPGLALGHTRLALLDLSERGNQPLWDSGGRHCLVYNGEIYNFQELRQGLEERGVCFRTTTDTEVILQNIIHEGLDETLKKLRGMFAFAWYDRETEVLCIVRDRFGIKPLVLYEDETKLIFSSEIKAFQPWIKLQANPFPMAAYLLGFGGPTQNRCFYKDVMIVPPGSVVRLKLGERPRINSFTRVIDMLDAEETEKLATLRPVQLVDRVDEQLSEAVERMLFADAPVGALCSGGVDSSILMAMAARKHNNLAIFHANVKGRWSELDAAQILSKHLRLDLKVVDVDDQDFIDLIPDVMAHYEHPFTYHPNSIPFLMVAQLVRQHEVKAVLSGEGSDECFLGYAHLAQEPFRRAMEQVAKRVHNVLARIPFVGRLLSATGQESGTQARSLFSLFERELEEDEIRLNYEAFTGSKADWNVRSLYLLGYHLRTLLHRNDVLGMAASIEARFPFLDESLVKTAVNLPHAAKIRFSPTSFVKAHPFLRDKWIVRQVADRYLPKKLSRRRKYGFGTSAFQRMKISGQYFMNSYVPELLDLSRRELTYLMENAGNELKNRLLLLDVWGRICIEGSALGAVQHQLREHVRVSGE